MTASRADSSAILPSARRLVILGWLSVFGSGLLLGRSVFAQTDVESARYVPGLVAKYTDDRGTSIERVDQTIGNWADGAPAPIARGRPFDVVWRGYVLARPEGQYRFHAYCQGSLQLSLDGRQLIDVDHDRVTWCESKPVDVEFGWHLLEVTFAAPVGLPQLIVAWSGPGFDIEPLAAEHIYRDANAVVDDRVTKGIDLIRDLRCAACHHVSQRDEMEPAPSLTNVKGHLATSWVIQRLTDHERDFAAAMPSFGLSHEQAIAIAGYLGTSSRTNRQSALTRGNVESGKQLFLSVGCLACHQWNTLGRTLGPPTTLGTINLTHIADKRPPLFFDVYLHEPSKINADHRMPVFDLKLQERNDLAAFLSTLRRADPTGNSADLDHASTALGQSLVERLRCAACHRTSQGGDKAIVKTVLATDSDWQNSCLGKPNPQSGRPGFNLSQEQQASIRNAVAICESSDVAWNRYRGMEVMRVSRCLSCHSRGQSRGIEPTALSIAQGHPELAPLVSALVPPSLSRTGEKLRRNALQNAVERRGPRRRPWLKVRMPRYRFTDGELKALIDALIRADQFPRRSTATSEGLDARALEHAGARLVTAGGFGCTSCHAVGGIQPPDAPLNALAPDLAGVGQRVDRAWFDRWVRNPARIVPRIEMPSINVPVPGVLDQQLDHQLQAVWHVLNQPDFRPPQPNPVRVVRRTGTRDAAESAVVLTDVLHCQNRVFIKPFLVALPNRHNIFFDLESGQLVRWSIGDAAIQRTSGKSWFWQSAGTTLLTSNDNRSDIALLRDGQFRHAHIVGQFVTQAEGWTHIRSGVEFFGTMSFGTDDGPTRLSVTQRYSVDDSETTSGWRRVVIVDGVAPEDELRLRVVPTDLLKEVVWSEDRREAALSSSAVVRVGSPATAFIDQRGYINGLKPNVNGQQRLELHYATRVPIDQFPAATAAPIQLEPQPVDVVPGFAGVRLPIPDQMMPTGISWRPNGRMLVTSLKGRIWTVWDADKDGIEETSQCFSDELAAPFGVSAHEDHVDVVNKYGLLRLFDKDHDDFAERVITLAAGWGHTDDYHDWAVGLPRDADGGYFVGLSCQQDDRTRAAAHLRGRLLRIAPRLVDTNRSLSYSVQEVSAGHRFPIGIALSSDGQLFVTDNQGNYNPYNELNHVRPGSHFGFINQLESHGASPPLTAPAVNIPHPWTRSVNGICFLETPNATDRKAIFGPFEGHLVGCEYDTRRLVRLTLQKVGDTYQGAAYPFSLASEAGPNNGFLGPLTAAVSPRGEIYVGDIRDSGWGGGPNHGAIVRLTPNLSRLPAGIAEVKAIENGFAIRFTQPVDRDRAADLQNYSISSATRVATPAYGGTDQHRVTESIVAVQVSPDAHRVRLVLDELKAGFVYDFRLKNLTDGQVFHPNVAFYTMNVVP